MTREIVVQPDGRNLQVLTFEGTELSDWQKTFPKTTPSGYVQKVVWIGENKLAMGTFAAPELSPSGAAPPVTAAAPPAQGGAVVPSAYGAELEKMTVAQLQTQCGMKGLPYETRATKAELLKILRTAAAA